VREILILAIHLLVTLAKLLRPGGVRAVAAESLLLKHQLLISNRSRQRAPNLTSVDRFVLGLATLFVRPHRLPKGIDKLTASVERKLFAILTPQLLRSNVQTHEPDGAGRTPPTAAGVAG